MSGIHPSDDTLRALTANPGSGPVVGLNLLKIEPYEQQYTDPRG